MKNFVLFSFLIAISLIPPSYGQMASRSSKLAFVADVDLDSCYPLPCTGAERPTLDLPPSGLFIRGNKVDSQNKDKEKIPPRTRIEIYAGELFGAGVGATASLLVLGLSAYLVEKTKFYYRIELPLAVGFTSNVLLTSTGAWAAGKSLEKKGRSWWKSALGAGIGWGVGFSLITMRAEDATRALAGYLLFPSLGAVIGLNL